MKRQLHGVKSGFTLFELMVVIAIFWAFILATNIFNYSPQTESEKWDRMMVAISGRLKTELQNMSMGRMPKRNGDIAWVIQLDIGTGGLSMRYLTGMTATNPIYTGSFLVPFFDGDRKYEIKTVTWTGSITPSDWQTGSGIVLIGQWDITFTGGTSPSAIRNNTLLEIKVGYNSRTRKIILDRRTGKIIETKLY